MCYCFYINTTLTASAYDLSDFFSEKDTSAEIAASSEISVTDAITSQELEDKGAVEETASKVFTAVDQEGAEVQYVTMTQEEAEAAGVEEDDQVSSSLCCFYHQTSFLKVLLHFLHLDFVCSSNFIFLSHGPLEELNLIKAPFFYFELLTKYYLWKHQHKTHISNNRHV